MKKIYLVIIASLCVANVKAQLMSIATARTQTTGATVTVRGIITNGAEFGTSLRYVQDATGGIALYGSQASSVQRGDSVIATGTFTPYNNLSEINLTSINVISSGHTLPAPVVLTIQNGFTEQYECQLVQINSVHFTSTGNFIAATNYAVKDASDSGQVRTDAVSNIINAPIPVGNINIAGIMGHYNSLFQLLPRDLSDFQAIGSAPLFTTGLIQSNIAPYSFTVSFTTQNKGNTIIIYGTNPDSLNNIASDTTQTQNHSINLINLQPATIYYVKGISVNKGDSSFSNLQPMASASLSSGSIKIYFNRAADTSYSTGTKAISLIQSLKDTLIAYINRAKSTLDIMIYDVDDINGVITAINNAFNRGVKVRVVLDGGVSSTNLSKFASGIQKISSPTTSAYGIMHDKIMITDVNSSDPNVPVMWTGAADWTDEQLREDANDVIIFQDQTIARAATLEFNEMWGDTGALPNPSLEKFGPFKSVLIPKEYLIGGKRVECYFAPTDPCDINLENAVKTANKSMQFAIYTFTKTDIAYSFTDTHAAGVPILQGVMDDTTQTGTLPVFYILSPVMTSQNLIVDKLPYLIHHKYAIIDAFDTASDPQIVAGSYNWTNSATEENDENQIIIHDATITNIYLQEWAKLFESEGGSVVISGINNLKSTPEQLYLYPNPASNYINLNYSLYNYDKCFVQITDLCGRTIRTWYLNQSQGKMQLDIHDIPNGIYLLSLVSGNINRTLKFNVTR